MPPSLLLLALLLLVAMTFAGATFTPAEVVSGPAAPVKLAWSKPVGVGMAVAPPSIGADADLVLVPTMNVTKDFAREYYLVAHSLTSGAIEWTRQLSPKQGGCPGVQEDSLPFTASSFVGNGEVVANFWFQEDVITHCSGFVLLDCKTGHTKSRQTVDAGFSYTANMKGLLYIAHIEANLWSKANNSLFRLAPPTFALSAPAAKFEWPTTDVADVKQEPNILVSPQQRLLVLFQYVSTETVELVGLDPTTLKPLWSTKAPASLSSLARPQLSGPRHDIILVKTDSSTFRPYNTSVAAYDATNGTRLWQQTVMCNTRPVITLHGLVGQGTQQLVCATEFTESLGANLLTCSNPFTGDSAFSKQLTAQQHFQAIYGNLLLVQDSSKGQLMAIDPFTRTVAWAIPAEEGLTHVDVADDNSFLLLSSATGLAKWAI